MPKGADAERMLTQMALSGTAGIGEISGAAPADVMAEADALRDSTALGIQPVHRPAEQARLLRMADQRRSDL